MSPRVLLTDAQRQAIRSIVNVLDAKWDDKLHSVDWIRLEDMLDVILREGGGIPDEIRVKLAREAVDAWTRRGHFMGGQYINKADYGLV